MQADSLPAEPQGKPIIREVQYIITNNGESRKRCASLLFRILKVILEEIAERIESGYNLARLSLVVKVIDYISLEGAILFTRYLNALSSPS